MASLVALLYRASRFSASPSPVQNSGLKSFDCSSSSPHQGRLPPPWRRRTNVWRRVTSPTRGAKRLRSAFCVTDGWNASPTDAWRPRWKVRLEGPNKRRQNGPIHPLFMGDVLNNRRGCRWYSRRQCCVVLVGAHHLAIARRTMPDCTATSAALQREGRCARRRGPNIRPD
jgi:hypothetical protein